ncbi:ABC transporter substrate-binding protein [Alkaliphilus transvaalensis]|uniref:ABC transporter substrate-binding protein n=1 Tax=Alkaliphilus transvaalensis TaxID=114628 RepID=UPI00054D2FD6|nr:glycine betaine ABC transporter substrate-binding protein [Alkaliphilus transvaalensis]
MNILLKKSKVVWLLIAILMTTSIMAACSPKGDRITIGSKNFTESRLLATMFKVLIEENTDLQVEVREFGGTQLVFEALRTGSVDIYPEYTGTAYTVMLGYDEILTSEETYEIVKEEFEENYNIEWLEQLGFNNTYTLTVRREMAEELGLKTYTDLLEYDQDLILGSTMEFLERPDGYLGLQDVYGFNFKDERGFDPGLTYMAARDGHVDVIDAFATDGRIPAFDLYVLEDDKEFFPPYYAAPLLNGETAEAHPELREILSILENQISDEEMQNMNYEIDEQERSEEQVAREFLQSKGLI